MGQGSTTAPAAEGFRIYPPLLAVLCLAGTLALHLMMGGGHDVLARHIIGLIITAGGTGLSFFAAALFQARETTKNPYGEPSSFVVMMPYTFTRNPMYLGLSTVLFGLAIFFGSVVMLLAPAIFAVVIDRMVIPREEETMERLFGAQYLHYKTRVRRWI
jgi:protein-S-isoprenylcysteine O-methyltransferase Ste14